MDKVSISVEVYLRDEENTVEEMTKKFTIDSLTFKLTFTSYIGA